MAVSGTGWQCAELDGSEQDWMAVRGTNGSERDMMTVSGTGWQCAELDGSEQDWMAVSGTGWQ
eukprot:4092607-Pleurochrysis_carterae.AAC.1